MKQVKAFPVAVTQLDAQRALLERVRATELARVAIEQDVRAVQQLRRALLATLGGDGVH
jgi:hypothetical protein